MQKVDPLRSCLGCREVRPKEDLLRFVRDPLGVLYPDILRKLPGRGAYTCFNRDCFDTAVKKKQFSRSFKGEATLPDFDMTGLIARLLDEKITSLISLANKAGFAVSGSDKVMAALKSHTVSVLILATDTSAESSVKFLAVAEKAGVETFRFSIKERLGSPLGKEIRTAVAVMNSTFAVTLKTDLKRYCNFFEGGAK